MYLHEAENAQCVRYYAKLKGEFYPLNGPHSPLKMCVCVTQNMPKGFSNGVSWKIGRNI